MKWFVHVVKNYVNFKGRARRKEYWMYVLFYIIFAMVAGVLDNALGTQDPETGIGTIASLYSLALLLPSLGVAARRLHDTGKTGWLLLIGLIPIIWFHRATGIHGA